MSGNVDTLYFGRVVLASEYPQIDNPAHFLYPTLGLLTTLYTYVSNVAKSTTDPNNIRVTNIPTPDWARCPQAGCPIAVFASAPPPFKVCPRVSTLSFPPPILIQAALD